MTTALTATIRENRKQFGKGEFVVGYDTKLDGKTLHYIADIEGKSGAQMLADSHEAARIAYDEAKKAHEDATETSLGPTSLALPQAQRRYDKSSLAMREWQDIWYKLFEWKD